ncbi:DUF523 domain-containing protein [Peptacetobacter hominis]|uniref:DUF523 domain-containing protein n=1 Tax=Peptacetobacter hominis TaxID=2743610 RepID=A0A544QUI3_9FIRM|nr:DUF523 domain-containing protein [Peptacetobacter hominis]TQQ84351.1 DUF523 domain-containing protein [Peptacetobacter hominis]
MIAVSACLLGIDCKYSGGNNRNEKVIEFVKDKPFIAICPEQMGGLCTPRNPSEIKGGRGEDVLDKKATVISNTGSDVTENFVKGAVESFKLAELSGVDMAILKNGSPSCGSSRIYDGSFSGVKISGEGVTTALFRKNGIKVISEDDI